jgi:hypothetical protein
MGNKLKRILHSPLFSLVVLVILVGCLGYIAYSVTESYKIEPDFGGMVTIRQTSMGGRNGDSMELSQSLIYRYITSREVLIPIAEKYNWKSSYEDMCKNIQVRERLATQNSYILVVNSSVQKRSTLIARALAASFLAEYRKQWNLQSKLYLRKADGVLEHERTELKKLKKIAERFQAQGGLRPLNNEVEMTALNQQILDAQNQFMTAYGAYISRLEEKRFSTKLELDLARQVATDEDPKVQMLTRQLAELDRQSVAAREQFKNQKPDLYRMTAEPVKLTGLPNDVLYLYDNVQTLPQIKLSLIVGSLIKEKEQVIEDEIKKKNTIERMLASNSCDVFVREVY